MRPVRGSVSDGIDDVAELIGHRTGAGGGYTTGVLATLNPADDPSGTANAMSASVYS
jgi:hypothetical protein